MIRHATHVALAVVVVVSMAATPALAATPAATEDPQALSGAPALAQTESTTANGCTFPFTETDATGTEVTVDAPPERVVTLSPSAAQTMWEIGDAREKVVGVNPNAYYLDGAETRPSVFDIGPFGYPELTPNVSKVEAQNPDLVLAPNVIPDSSVESLRAEGLTVYRFDRATDIEFIYQKTRLTGKLVGECDAADRRTAELRAQVETIRRATAGVERKDVFTYLGPGFGDSLPVTAGSNTFIDEIITVSGGENLGANYGSGFPSYEPSTVAASDPEWFTKTSDDPIGSGLQSTTAVQNDRTVRLNPDNIYQPAPRVVVAMTTLVRALHPERYRQARLGLLREEAKRDSGTWEIPYADADPLDSTVENDTAYLRVQNGDAPRTQFPVPDAFAANSTVRLTEVAVDTREPNPIFTVTVRNATADAPALPGEARLLAAYETDTEDLHMFATNATYTLSVPLESMPGEPSELTVYRRDGGGWAPVETTVRVNETSQTANVTASADRLTGFAVGVAGEDARSTVQSAPEPMAAYATPEAAGLTDPATSVPADESAAPFVDATGDTDQATGVGSDSDSGSAPGAGGIPVVALTALLAATLLVGRRR